LQIAFDQRGQRLFGLDAQLRAERMPQPLVAPRQHVRQQPRQASASLSKWRSASPTT